MPTTTMFRTAEERQVTSKTEADTFCDHCYGRLGYRKIMDLRRHNLRYHKKDCFEAAELKAAEEERRERLAREEAERETIRQQRETIRAKRGDWETYEMRPEQDTHERRLANLVSRSRTVIERHEEMVRDHAEKLLANPAHEVEWGTPRMLRQAAQYTVALEVKRAFEAGADVPTILEHFRDFVVQQARFVQNSTNPHANMLARQVLAEYGNALDTLDGGLATFGS